MSFRVLSTKILSAAQQQLLLNADVSFVHTNFIQIKAIPFNSPLIIQNAIFTSMNALKIVLDHKIEIQNCFCVGTKTKAFAESQNLQVIAFANDAENLSSILVKEYAEKSFTFFCGAKRRDILPNTLKAKNIALKEIITYNTFLTPKKMDSRYNGVLFFSPSAVESYVQLNALSNTIAFCIGHTTATLAQKHTNKIITANIPSIENVLVQVIKHSKMIN
ncbi:uroporphyrinogen-III synthase [Ascidiimonas sp. W6]|uniref:uroporphyrinogen-III synthase n=1 Tax=Ascidiimonas meishanensis TaxID=3128903 RepID=UPI0030ECADE1